MERLEGLAKLTGREQYVDDLAIEGCLWGMTVRSPVARGRIRAVRFGTGVDWSQITIVDHRDIPGENVVALIEPDQPALAADRVRHMHEPVVLLAHHDRETVRRAVRAVTIEVDPEPPIFDFTAVPAPEQIQHGTDNVLAQVEIAKGDVERALALAWRVVEGVYETHSQEHVYIETQGMVAWVERGVSGDVVVVKGSLQCPYYVSRALATALGRDESAVRVLHAATGGGFGGKEEYPSTLAIHAALLALKSGRPVKMIYDRGEDMVATTKRHPARVRHRTGVDRDGRLVAQEIDVVLDGGAYVTLSPVVLSRGLIHGAGPYSCDNVRLRGRAMFTNSVPYGAFRGFGAPQTLFACERQMDVVARAIGLDPVELRRRNLIRDGQSTSTGQVISDGTDRIEVLDRALAESGWSRKQVSHRAFNALEPWRRRGIGLACFYHGAGFTGSGEVYLDSVVHVAGLADGRIEIRSANTEMGQGTQTIFVQIAAERTGYDASDVTLAPIDTAVVPNSGPTVASRTAMVVGRLIERACDALRARLGLDDSARGTKLRDAIVAWHREHAPAELVAEARYEKPPGIHWDDKNYRGDAYAAFAWATYVAEVEVDLRTYQVRVLDFVAVQEVGKVLNSTLATGQIQGGVAQGIGWTLMEDVRLRDGAMANGQLTNYVIPTSDDLPPIRVFFLENPYPGGAQGSKGIGELPIDGAAPAIANAVADALGVEPCTIPLVPERIMELMSDGQRAAG